MMKIIISVFISFIVFFSVSAQHDHDFLIDPMSKKSDVRYTIRADVDAQLGIVNGILELEFVNYSEKEIDTLIFSMLLNEFRTGTKLADRYFLVDYDTLFTSDTGSGYLRIDSINYLGVTLGSEMYQIYEGYLRVKLPSKVTPGEKRHLFMAFESKIPVVVEEKRFVRLFKDFFPKMLRFQTDNKYDFGWYESDIPYADYYVELKIKGGYQLSHPGKLLNENHLFRLPDTGQLWINYAQFLDSSDEHSYTISSKKSRDFQFAVSKENQRDRLMRDNYTIDAQYHPEKCKYEWQGRTVLVADSLIKQLEKTYGEFPYKKLELCAIDSTFLQYGTNPIIFIPRDVKKEYDMSLFILSELSKLYVPKIYADDLNESYFSDGLATFMSMQTAFQRYENNGYSDLKRYEKRVKKKTKAYKLYTKDRKSLDPLGYPISIPNDDIAFDIEAIPRFFHNSYRKIPASFETLRYIAGDSIFSAVLLKSLSEFRYSTLTTDKYIEYFSSQLENEILSVSYIHSLIADIDSIDFAIHESKIEQNNDSSFVTADVTSNTNTIIPLEIAFVGNRNDTLYRTIHPKEFIDRRFSLSEKFNKRIKGIVLNPRYAHGELTRSDNYYSLTPQKFNMQEPGWFFLGFRSF